MTTLYVISFKTGELLGSRDASIDIKTEQPVIPPYQTPVAIPEGDIPSNHQWLYLDQQGNPARYHQDGSWIEKPRPKEVTAYHKQTLEPKEFDDASLVTDDYTLEQYSTNFDYWTESGWKTDEQAKYEHDYQVVNDTRYQLYVHGVDRLLKEANMIRMTEGDETKAADYEAQAVAAYEKIKVDNPFPEPPELTP